MSDDTATNAIDVASAGVQDLARAATGVLEQAGPAGALAQPVVDALRNVWEGYFGSPIPPDGTNWNAYTHEQLYQMLWDNADVGSVSTAAADWGRHSTELVDHADSMHRQRTAMQSNWNGEAAGLAANQLGELGDRTSDIGSRAGTVQGAVQQSGDALAHARNAMPPPPGDPTALLAAGASAGAGVGAVAGGVLGAGAGGIGAAPGALMGAAIGAVAGGGGSLFLAHVAAAEKKAQAVHVMQSYETSLSNSSHAIAAAAPGAVGNGMPAQTSSAGFAPAGASGGVAGGGVPWNQLVGADPLEAGARGAARMGGALPGAMLARPDAMSARAAAARGAGGMVPPGSLGRQADEEEQDHRSRLPTIDHKLFDVDRQGANPVIGQ